MLVLNFDLLSKNRINKLLNGTHGESFVTADSLSPIPVDSESRLDVVEVTYPGNDQEKLIFNPSIHKQIINFNILIVRNHHNM